MTIVGGSRPCKWCGTSLASVTAPFCATCEAPQTFLAQIFYAVSFATKNLAIPLTIGIVTLVLTSQQQEAALIIANRQKLAEALSEVGKTQADSRLAYMQIALMALPNGEKVSAKDLKDAAIRLDVAITSFGAKLGPFEEFARRTKYYVVEPGDGSPLQNAWDKCFVSAYWGTAKKPGYLHFIEDQLSKCNDTVCPKTVAQELKRIHDEFYKGYCDALRDRSGRLIKELPLSWFDRELRRISIQQHPIEQDIYKVGAE